MLPQRGFEGYALANSKYYIQIQRGHLLSSPSKSREGTSGRKPKEF